MPNQAAPQPNMPEFERAPERNPDRYPSSAQTNQTKCAQLAETFFKDSVKRARDRNVRLVNYTDAFYDRANYPTTDKARWKPG